MASLPTERSCGSCMMCCKLTHVTSLDKLAGSWCRYSKPTVGCQIYDTRPDECRNFMCQWLIDLRLDETWKPINSHFLMFHNKLQNTFIVMLDNNFPYAWKAEPFYTGIKETAERLLTSDIYTIVVHRERFIFLFPDREEVHHIGSKAEWTIKKIVVEGGINYQVLFE